MEANLDVAITKKTFSEFGIHLHTLDTDSPPHTHTHTYHSDEQERDASLAKTPKNNLNL